MRSSAASRRSGRLARAAALCAAAALAVTGCASFPADPENSLVDARGGQLHVGATEHAPWVQMPDDDGAPSGPEAELVTDYAEHIGAEVAWTHGSESQLVGQLDAHELDMVIGGFDNHTPWKSQAAVTRPYGTASDGSKRVLLVEMGENALLSDVESYLIATEDQRQGLP